MFPGLASILRPKDPTFGILPKWMAESRDINEVMVGRVHFDPPDLASLRKSYEGPRPTRVHRLPHTASR